MRRGSFCRRGGGYLLVGLYVRHGVLAEISREQKKRFCRRNARAIVEQLGRVEREARRRRRPGRMCLSHIHIKNKYEKELAAPLGEVGYEKVDGPFSCAVFSKNLKG